MKNDIVIKNKFEYDQRGYLLRQKEQINSEPEVIVNELEYWETGQVKKKKIHSADNGAHFVQTVDFQYNIKGWLTQINNPASLSGDLFAMKLDYTQGTNKEYNGNISAISWASATYTDIKKYNFNYDGLGRLSNADYSDGQSRDYSVNLTYDLNGNITTLNRKGRFADGNFGNIDNLTYSYKSGGQSNQLDRVDDVNATNNQAHGFTDLGAFAANEYNYDDNGNMLSDANRQITQITYNSMNLPVEITFSGGSGTTLTNTYLAGGTKLRKEKEGGKTDYIGSFIYEDDELKYIQTGGGRIVVNGATYARQYYLTDHLGNIRLIFDTQGHVLQEDSYYPFGSNMEGLSYVNETLLDPEYKNKYLYNGKEQDDLTKFFEYGFRDYDAQLGRWHCIDPSAESYIASSPYHFVGNNPINNLELDGANFQQEFDDEARRYLESGKYSKGGGGVYRNAYFGFGGADDGYTYDWSTGQYKNADGRTVSWGEVGNSLGNKGSILTPTSENMKENGISGYATSIDGKIIKVYIDGFGEVDLDGLFGPITSNDLRKVYNLDYRAFVKEITNGLAEGHDNTGNGFIPWLFNQTLWPDGKYEDQYPDLMGTIAVVNCIVYTYDTSPKYDAKSETMHYGDPLQWGVDLVGELYPYFTYKDPTQIDIEAQGGYYYHIRIQWRIGPPDPKRLLGSKY